MSGISGSGNNSSWFGSLFSKKESLELPDYDDNQSSQKNIDAFKKDVFTSLGTKSENIEVKLDESGNLIANIKDQAEQIKLVFKDKSDLPRMARYAMNSSTLSLSDFGNENANKKIKITNYEDGLSKDSQIKLFKDDIEREMKTEKKNLEIHIVDDNLVVRKKDSPINYLIDFEDQKDFERFLAYAKDTKSIRLDDFGIKKQEGSVSVGGSTSLDNAKGSAYFSESVSYSSFLGDSAKHRIKVDLTTDQNLNLIPDVKNLREFNITYENAEMPFTGTKGELKLKYHDGGFGVDGKYEYLDTKLSNWGKEYVQNLKNKNEKTIALTAGAVVVAGVGVWATSKYMKKEKDFDIPINTKIYNNGVNELKAGISPTITLGNGKFEVGLHKGFLEANQNIASGTNAKEKVEYDVEKKELKTELEGNYERANVKITNNYSFQDSNQTKTYISIGKSQTVSDEINVSYGYSQEFDHLMNTINQSIGFGIQYIPNESWEIDAGGSAFIPKSGEKTKFGVSGRTTYKF